MTSAFTSNCEVKHTQLQVQAVLVRGMYVTCSCAACYTVAQHCTTQLTSGGKLLSSSATLRVSVAIDLMNGHSMRAKKPAISRRVSAKMATCSW